MHKIKIGLSMLHCLSEPYSKMIKRLNNAETRFVEIIDEGFHTLNKKRVAKLNQIAKSNSIQYTVHAPFADINIASPSKQILSVSLKRLKESMAYAHALESKLWIFHPGNRTGISMFYPGDDWKQNVKSILELHKTAEEYGLNIAIENLPGKYGFLMKSPEDFLRFYEEAGLRDIGIVLDVGHANLEGQIDNFLKKFPGRIMHIHLSDNFGENDLHLGIGYGKIDWQWFAEILHEMDYDKTVVIESIEHVKESLQKLQKLLA